MELRQLRSLVAVSEEKTFVRAAQRLHLAQPALSRRIRSFEEEIGTVVFNRGRTGVTLTAAGEICFRAARSIITNIDSAVDRARMASAGKAGTCTIYVSQWCVWSDFTGRMLTHLSATDPAIEIIVHEGPIGAQWEWLRDRKVDLAITVNPPSRFEDLQSEILLDDVANMALLTRSHPLAGRESLRLSELADEVLLTYDASVLDVDLEFDAAFESVGFTPGKIRTVSTTEAMITRVAAGLGWSIHRRSLRGKIPGVAMVPIEGFSVPMPITIVRRRNETGSHVLEVARRIREVAATEHPSMYHANGSKMEVEKPELPSPGTSPAMELRDLRYYAAVVEERSIGRAATRLHLTQPGLSRQIRDLERDLGFSLVEREARGIVPTPAGQALYFAARSILHEVARLPAELERARRAATGRCTIAAVPSAHIRDVLSTVLREGSRRFPDLELFVKNVPTPLQPAAVSEGEYDIGLCHHFFHLTAGFSDLDCRDLLSDVIEGALLPTSHPLASRSSIRFEDLGSMPFMFFRRDFHPAFHDFVFETFRRLGYRPVLGPMQEGLQTLWSLASEGKGWSLAFGSHRKSPPPGLIAVPIEGFHIPWGMSLLTRRGEKRATTLALVDMILEAAKQIEQS